MAATMQLLRRTPALHQPRSLRCRSSSSSSSSSSRRASGLGSIRDFIQNECPVRGWDGFFKEQLQWQDDLTPLPVIGVSPASLVAPGQRQLFDVSGEAMLEQIIAHEGKVVLCCFEPDSSGTKLAAPRKGSWACVGVVAGLHRLPGSRALVRLLVVDRVVVQALDCSQPDAPRALASPLRDRWAFFVRADALQQHTAGGNASPGLDVTTAVEQVQDACGELLLLLHQLERGVAAVMAVGSSSDAALQLQQAMEEHEAADELCDLLAWVQLASPMDLQQQQQQQGAAAAVPAMLPPADAELMERAWRLSFAPFAAKGLAAALAGVSAAGSRRSPADPAGVQKALETMDLGMRLEAALDLAQQLTAQLALAQSLQ